MNIQSQLLNRNGEDITMNLAIVGGGGACKSFLESVQKRSLPYLKIHIVGVCDRNPKAEGLLLAKELGIYTTHDFKDLFSIRGLDGIIELTHDTGVLMDLIRLRPEGLLVLDHNIGKLFETIYTLDQKIKSKEQEILLQKMVSGFLLQHANERMVVLDPDFTILDANEAYLKAVKKSREEVIGGHCYETTHQYSSPCSEWQTEIGCPLMETMRTGQSAHTIHEHSVEGGHLTYCDLETYPIKMTDSGEILRVIEIWRDITEQLSTRWEMRLNEMKTDLGRLVQEDRMMSLGKLSASCVHEINNPIQGLLTFCSIMQAILSEGSPGQDDLRQFKEYLNLMSAELERCGNIVSGLLSFARESALELRDVELNDIVQSVVDLTRHRMELQNVSLVMDLAEDPIHIRGDVNQLQQCFLNLIFNAIEAMPDGGQLTITSRRNSGKRRIMVIVRDSGEGIPPEIMDHIFDPFFTTKGEGEGTGLGLSIVYGIVKGHGGSIEVKSEAGEGSTFTLNFPISVSM